MSPDVGDIQEVHEDDSGSVFSGAADVVGAVDIIEEQLCVCGSKALWGVPGAMMPLWCDACKPNFDSSAFFAGLRRFD
jgi:hypothetical protein